jgi:zinc protease
MKRILPALAAALLFAITAAHGQDDGVIEIPYTQYTLDNGLTLIVHVDRKAPIVAVNVWYDVGSADEPEGKTGFAHLFEHLMFNGSENFNDDYFKALDRLGATGTNGTTNFDRTNYFQVVPTSALDSVLWLESDRMGHMLGAISQERLDEQRGVVQNEKRQGENQPYGKVFLTIFENTYPKGHPYAHSVIGSMEDLNAASLDDAKNWFRQYYGPNNAVLVVAGDVNPDDVRQRVERFFGDIPAGPPLIKPAENLARRTAESRVVMEDRVPQPRLYMIWNGPAYGMDEVDTLTIAGDVLSTGKSSRLYKRLVYQDQIATDVSAFAFPRELGGLFGIIATAQPGGNLAELEAAIREELAQFREEGPSRDELARSKTGQRADFLRGIERVGGFGGKSDVLAASMIYLGSPDAHEESQARILNATAAQVQEAANEWLDDGVFILEVHPFQERSTVASSVDRSAGLPVPEQFPDGKFPDFERATLSNGLEVVLAERNAVPVIEMNLQINAGYAADVSATPGTASLAMNMLDEGTKRRSALEISDELATLGMTLGTGSNLDISAVTMSALKENLEDSLDLYADVILNPAFPENELERLRKNQIAAIQREQVNPGAMVQRVLPTLMYGEGHAYATPLSGTGTVDSVSAIGVDDLEAFHDTWVRPNNATLLVVGDVSMDTLLPQLEDAFARWESAEVPEKNLATVRNREQPTIYIMNRPGAEQSIIATGHVVPPKSDFSDLAIESMNQILGGSFTARMNMNLREDKSWSYGARTLLLDAAAQRPWLAFAPVQSDRTADSMAEIQKEIVQIRGEVPPTDAELAKIKDQRTLTLPGRWQTNGAVVGDLAEIVRFDLPDNHWDNYAEQVRALSLDDVSEQAERVLDPNGLIWVVVGDRARIEDDVKALGLGEVRYLDANGKEID